MRLAPDRVAEIEAWKDGMLVNRKNWSGSNLFAHPNATPAVTSWSANVTVDEITPTSYLCVAVEGNHGKEGCYASIKLDGKLLIGAPNRAVSYPTNPWEYPTRSPETGYTYYFPLDDSMVGKDMEVVLLGMEGGGKDLQPSVWITARELPFTTERISIKN